MHRRILVLRRFGAMSFGLGYFEDGVWVDHAAEVASRAVGDDGDSDEDGLAWEAIHTWFSCCGSELTSTIPVMTEPGTSERGARPAPVAASSISS